MPFIFSNRDELCLNGLLPPLNVPHHLLWCWMTGPAGLVCAETLRQEGFTDRIVICTMDKHPPYDRPKLSKVCTQTVTS